MEASQGHKARPRPPRRCRNAGPHPGQTDDPCAGPFPQQTAFTRLPPGKGARSHDPGPAARPRARSAREAIPRTSSPATIAPQPAMTSGFSQVTRTEVSTATGRLTSRSRSSGNETTETASTATAKRNPTPVPITTIAQPAGVVSRLGRQRDKACRRVRAKGRRMDRVGQQQPGHEDHPVEQAQHHDPGKAGRAQDVEHRSPADRQSRLAASAEFVQPQARYRADQGKARKKREQKMGEVDFGSPVPAALPPSADRACRRTSRPTASLPGHPSLSARRGRGPASPACGSRVGALGSALAGVATTVA